MRKGAKRVDWTTSDEAYLVESAGTVPIREICRRLKRSRQSVYQKAKRLRAQGKEVDLRRFEPTTFLCPSCGCARTLGRKSGICDACKYHSMEAEELSRISALWPFLPQRERDLYEQTDAETGSRRDPKPKAPRLSPGTPRYRREKAMEEWAIAVERVETGNAKRAWKAAAKRRERIEKKVKSMTNCESSQMGVGKCSES